MIMRILAIFSGACLFLLGNVAPSSMKPAVPKVLLQRRSLSTNLDSVPSPGILDHATSRGPSPAHSSATSVNSSSTPGQSNLTGQGWKTWWKKARRFLALEQHAHPRMHVLWAVPIIQLLVLLMILVGRAWHSIGLTDSVRINFKRLFWSFFLYECASDHVPIIMGLLFLSVFAIVPSFGSRDFCFWIQMLAWCSLLQAFLEVYAWWDHAQVSEAIFSDPVMSFKVGEMTAQLLEDALPSKRPPRYN
jgi:hypothetical protein